MQDFIIKTIQDPKLASSMAVVGEESFCETFGHLYHEDDLRLFLDENHCVASYENLILSPKSQVWSAQTNQEEIVAYAVAGPCTLPVPELSPGAGELKRLYVLRQFQGKRLGNTLLKVALDWMNEHFEDQYLSVYAENHGAQRLYERYGFRKIHDYHFMVGGHADPEFIMQRLE